MEPLVPVVGLFFWILVLMVFRVGRRAGWTSEGSMAVVSALVVGFGVAAAAALLVYRAADGGLGVGLAFATFFALLIAVSSAAVPCFTWIYRVARPEDRQR
jgi:hypothetical protein